MYHNKHQIHGESLDNREMAIHMPDAAEHLLRLLRLRCHHSHFRPSQLEAMEAVLQGKDVLLVLPTGGELVTNPSGRGEAVDTLH
mmetsp:Transcript_19664/g.59460  ORF Transcript_19664/g.59460 Transcript_19664/m.59460 type:complete len:85 (+) Transcript_19664:129-383(+)